MAEFKNISIASGGLTSILRQRRTILFLFLVLVLISSMVLVGVFFVQFDRLWTPEKVKMQINDSIKSDWTKAQVKEWIHQQGWGRYLTKGNGPRGTWIGDSTPFELAGIAVASVDSRIITGPPAAEVSLGLFARKGTIHIFFFFDKEERFLGFYVYAKPLP